MRAARGRRAAGGGRRAAQPSLPRWGIDFDPRHPAARGLLERQPAAMRPLLTQHSAAGEDLGVRQAGVDRAVHGPGMRSSVTRPSATPDGAGAGPARLERAFAASVDGTGPGDLVGGYGVRRGVLAALGHHGEEPAGRRVALYLAPGRRRGRRRRPGGAGGRAGRGAPAGDAHRRRARAALRAGGGRPGPSGEA
ncbi:hypothetical protein EF910_14870 [Streptomyces sp. WAC07149]|nr:hypothetical protein EF910_14870 [Streptomyces sp. WAC07149]